MDTNSDSSLDVSKFPPPQQAPCQRLTFTDLPYMRRAVPLKTVTRNFGRFWANETESDDLYSLSAAVTKDYCTYISHDRDVKRPYWKWCSTHFHFNFSVAALASIGASALATLFTMLGALPKLGGGGGGSEEQGDAQSQGFWPTLVGGPVFFAVLFFRFQIADFFRMKTHPPDVFVDDFCINQCDELLRTRGVKKLGAFVAASHELLILHTDEFLVHLRTLYEVVSFLVQKSVAQERDRPDESATDVITSITVLELMLVAALLMAMAFSFLSALSRDIFIAAGADAGLRFLLLLPGAFIYIVYARNWKREQSLMKEQLLSFDITTCCCWRDRAILFDNVLALMLAYSNAEEDVQPDVVRLSFNEHVRRTVSEAVELLLPWRSFEYFHYAFLGFLLCGTIALEHLAVLPLVPSRERSLHLAGAAVEVHLALIVWPLLFALQEHMMSFNLHWDSYGEWMWLSANLIGWSLLAAAYYKVLLKSVDESADSSRVLGTCCILALLSAYLASLLLWFGPGHHRQMAERVRLAARRCCEATSARLPIVVPQSRPKRVLKIFRDNHDPEDTRRREEAFNMLGLPRSVSEEVVILGESRYIQV